MPAIRRRRTFGRRKSRRYGMKSRSAYRARYNKTRRTKRRGKFQTVIGVNPRTIVPRNAYIKFKMSNTIQIITLSGSNIYQSSALQLNDLDNLEDNGYRNLNAERLANLYNKYMVYGAKIRYRLQNTTETVTNTAFWSFFGVQNDTPLYLTSALTPTGVGVGYPITQMSEIPNCRYIILENADSKGNQVMTHYVNMKRFLGRKPDYDDWGGNIIHTATDHWQNPSKTIGWSFGITTTSGLNWGSSLNVANVIVEMTIYARFNGTDQYYGSA